MKDERLVERIDRFLGGAYATGLRAGLAEQAMALREGVNQSPQGPPVLVVAGEPKRGKSSIVNAILGRDAAPIASPSTGAAYSVFRLAPGEESARAHASRAGQEFIVDVPCEQMPRWGEYLDSMVEPQEVRWVDVAVNVALLSEITILDAPGVSGMHGGNAELTLSVLKDAAALLFVTDASAPLSAAEIAFLQRSAGRVGTVLLTLAKKDLYRGWEQVLAEDRALLAKYLPELASTRLGAVSSTLALKAQRFPPDSKMGNLLRQESGIDNLRSLICREVIASSQTHYERGRVEMGRRLVIQADHLRSRQLAIARGEATIVPRLAKAESAAAAYAKDNASWAQTLHRQMFKLRETMTMELVERFAHFGENVEHRINTCPRGDLAALPTDLESELGAQWNEILTSVHGRLAVLVEQVIGPVDDIVAAVESRVSAPEEQVDLTVSGPALDVPESQQTLSKMTVMNQFSTGRGLARSVPILGLIPGVGLALGFKYASVGRDAAEDVQLRNQYKAWFPKQLNLAQQRMRTRLNSGLSDLEEWLAPELRQHVETQANQLKQELEQARLAQEASDQERAELITRQEQERQRNESLAAEASAIIELLQYE